MQNTAEARKRQNARKIERRKRIQKRKKKKRILFIIKLVIIGIISIIAISIISFTIYKNKTFKNYVVLTESERTNTAESSYLAFRDSMLKYSKDGIAYVNKSGEDIWNQSYNMNSPKVVIGGNYIVVADLDGNSLYILNQNGKYVSVSTQYPITAVEVSESGMVALVLEDKNSNYISLYGKDGTNYYDIKASIDQTGQPVDVALSNDGKRLVISYIAIDGLSFKSVLAFYDYSSIGENEEDNCTGFFEYPEKIVPKVEFINENVVCAYSERKAILFNMKHIPSIIKEIEFDTDIRSIFSNDEYIGFIYQNTEANEKDDKYKIEVYDIRGNKILTKNTNLDYTKVQATNDEFILSNDLECEIYYFSGKKKFSYNFEKNIIDIVPISKRNQYILIDELSLNFIKLK